MRRFAIPLLVKVPACRATARAIRVRAVGWIFGSTRGPTNAPSGPRMPSVRHQLLTLPSPRRATQRWASRLLQRSIDDPAVPIAFTRSPAESVVFGSVPPVHAPHDLLASHPSLYPAFLSYASCKRCCRSSRCLPSSCCPSRNRYLPDFLS